MPIAIEEADKTRIAAEEAEKTRIATEEADKTKIAAEEADKTRIAAEEADKTRIATEESEQMSKVFTNATETTETTDNNAAATTATTATTKGEVIHEPPVNNEDPSPLNPSFWRPKTDKQYDYIFEGCCKADGKIFEEQRLLESDGFQYNSNLLRVTFVTLTFGLDEYSIRMGDFNISTGMIFLYADCVSFRDSEGTDTTNLFMHFIQSFENSEGNFIIVH